MTWEDHRRTLQPYAYTGPDATPLNRAIAAALERIDATTRERDGLAMALQLMGGSVEGLIDAPPADDEIGGPP